MNKSFLLLLASLLSPCAAELASAQTVDTQAQESPIVIPPLFEYPIAPESMENLTDRSNWMMANFWTPFNFKSTAAVDQNALNHAFMVYSGPMRWADRAGVMEQTDKLLDKLAKNPTLLLQFTKAAEENLYGPRAQMIIDEVYIRYLDKIVGNKKIPESRRARYKHQLDQLRNSKVGDVAPSFDFMNPSGQKETFRPGWLTVIEFGDPSCADCRYAKLKMNTDLKFSNLVEKGKINVLFIIPDAEDGWQEELANYPALWHTGASDKVSEIYDMRTSPTLYVIGTDNRIIAKTHDVNTAISIATAEATK